MPKILDLSEGLGQLRWSDLAGALEAQGYPAGVIVDSSSANGHNSGVRYSGHTLNDTLFCLAWFLNRSVILSMSQEEPELVEAFARVIGYRPFCRYIDSKKMLTFEFDGIDSEGRFEHLQTEESISNLQWIL